MAVVLKYGRANKDPASIFLPEPVQAEGRLRQVASGPITITNGDSINSTYYFGKVSSSAILLPDSIVYHEAITGVTSIDFGLWKDGVNTVMFGGGSAQALLAAAQNIAAASNKPGLAAVTTANLGKRVYELLGYANDPGFEYDIVGTINAAATATGIISALYRYAKK